jgi:ribosomal protein S4
MLDIWGHSFIYRRPTRETQLIKMMEDERIARKWYYKREFIYSFRKKIRFRRKKRIKKKYLLPRYLKHYYLVLRMSDFRRFQDKAAKKVGRFDSNFLIFVECRLFMLVYRLNYINNIFMIKSLVDAGMFTINNEIESHSNFTAGIGDVISIVPNYKELIRMDMILRFQYDIVFFRIPIYLITNYKFLFSIFWSQPRLKNVYFPVDQIDVFIGSEYYQPQP